MEFMNAFLEMKNEKIIARKKWINRYLILKDERILDVCTDSRTVINYILDIEDLISDDWELWSKECQMK